MLTPAQPTPAPAPRAAGRRRTLSAVLAACSRAALAPTLTVAGALQLCAAVLTSAPALAADPPAVAEARKLQATDPLAAVKALQMALGKTTDAGEQSALRLALVDAYLAQGRPIEAAQEAETWLKANATDAQREAVLLTLIKAQRESNQWDAAASTCRSFVRDFPKSAQRDAVLRDLIQITRMGQQSLSGEISAVGELLAANPNVADAGPLLLRLAKIQEASGDVAGAVASLQKFVARFPADPLADEMGWRAVWLTQDRLRKTAEALVAGQAHLKAYPKHPNLAGDWKYLGDLARSIEKWDEAKAAYAAALAADPQSRDALAASAELLAQRGSSADLQRVLDQAEKTFPKDPMVAGLQVALLRKQLDEKKLSPQQVVDTAGKLLPAPGRTGDVCAVLEDAARRAAEAGKGSAADTIVPIYRAQISAVKTGAARTELALRLAAQLRSQGKLAEATKVLADELTQNPQNRKDLTRDYLMGVIDSQKWEMDQKKRTKYELDAPIREVLALVEPVAYMNELRAGLDEVSAELNRRKVRDESAAIRLGLEKLAAAELAVLVDAANRESRRDGGKAAEALLALLPKAKDKPELLALIGDAPWQAWERTKPEQRARLLPVFAALAAARPEDLNLLRDAGDKHRQAGKDQDAIKYYTQVLAAPVTPGNATAVGEALGALLDLQAYQAKDSAAVAALAEQFEKLGSALPVEQRQRRYRQLAEIYQRTKDAKPQVVDYLKKAVALGLSDTSMEAARVLLGQLSAEEAASMGQQLLQRPDALRWWPELALMVANRQAVLGKDLPGALALATQGLERRITTVSSDQDNWNTLRELVALDRDASDPKKVTDPERRKVIEGLKPLSPEQRRQLHDLAVAWLSSQQLQDVAREAIRSAGAGKDYGRQLELFSQLMRRTPANDGWYWDRNLEQAREEISRGNLGTASTMLRLLLKQSDKYGEDSRAVARNLLIQTFQKFGEDLLAVDEKSPIAALLKGASYLRLGEEKLAWEAYHNNAELFASKIDQVPAPYVLFVGNELAMGSDADRDTAEQLLRTWLARVEKQPDGVDAATQAAVSLKLADVFYYGRRFDVARAEYQSVMDKFPTAPEATEAQFRIGESFMYQKNYPEAAKVFEKLRKSKDADTSIRGTFMTGVLQYTSGARDEARETFKTLLDLAPSEALASKALYQLALIYGDDNRFREMLDMLETIGRLGREGKRWHTPGQNLTVMIQDPDMAIVQEATTVPVLVTTTNGDREQINLVAGSAGRGIYLAELPTALGAPKPGDRILQLLGSDVINYDYPDEFKARFKYVPPPQGNIRIASDAQFAAQSTKIEDAKKESVADKAAAANKIERAEDAPKEFRNAAEFKPGNPVYLRVIDADRSISTSVDRVEVQLKAASGDVVRAFVSETGPDSGVFEGVIQTAERPPEALASDSSMGRPAGMAADKDPATAWESQHDGQPGKWLAADLKDVYPVTTVRFASPAGKPGAIKDWALDTSFNGQVWEPWASTQKGRIAHGLSLNYGPMKVTRYGWSALKGALPAGAKPPETITDYLALVGAKLPDATPENVETLALGTFAPDATADVHVMAGYFYVPGPGRWTFRPVTGGKQGKMSAALVLDGRIIAAKWDDWREGVSVPVTPGWHRLAAFFTTHGETAPTAGLGYSTGQGGQKGGELVQTLITSSNKQMQMPAPAVYTVPAEPKVTATAEGAVTVEGGPVPTRFVRLAIGSYEGDYASVSNLVVAGQNGAKVYLPTDADLVKLADDDILQVSPGDEVAVSYADQVNTRTPGEARVLSGKLKATYFNGSVNAVSYDIRTGKNQEVSRTAKQLWRIDPGERIVADITDYDEDTSPQTNTTAFKVRTESGAELDLVASETGPTAGQFTKEVDTRAAGEATSQPTTGPARLPVRSGERIYLIYEDRLNTVPGGRVERVAEVEVVKPTVGEVNILPTRIEPPATQPAGTATLSLDPAKAPKPVVLYLPPEKKGDVARVVLAAPLTIEVYDPDSAKDSHSTVEVQVTTSAGAKLTIPLELSGAAMPRSGGRQLSGKGPAGDGRFVGQALLVLGKPNAEGRPSEAVSIEEARGLIGAWRYQAPAADGAGEGSVAAPVLAITGQDTITVTYVDRRTPDGKPIEHTAQARMVTDGKLVNMDRSFQNEIAGIHLGEKLFLKVEDGDRDLTPEADVITVKLTSAAGESEEIKLSETLGHSGVFSAEVASIPADKATPGDGKLQATFGDVLTVTYADDANTTGEKSLDRVATIQVAVGSDGQVAAFSKQFSSEEIAIETQFKLAECWFELFKSHNTLKQAAEAKQALEQGRAVLHEVREHHRGSAYEARVLYLLGSFHQELKEYDEALECFRTIVRSFPNSVLAPDAQYKLGQTYEDKGEMEQACEEYVRLAYTYPDNPLIAKCMVRLSDYFYKTGRFDVAANVCGQFLEQFPEHEWASKIAFRQGQSLYKQADAMAGLLDKDGKEIKTAAKGPVDPKAVEIYLAAARAFDVLVDRYPDSDLRADAMFWAGESYLKCKEEASAYRRYRRVTWDFPDSDAARFARGRLTLPEMQQAAAADAKGNK